MLIPGTTPTHEFELPFDTALLKEVKVIYSQDDEELFCKRVKDCNLDGNTIRIRLTQEETFLIDSRRMVQIQIRAFTTSGDALSTEIMTRTAYKCLDKDKEVLS